MVKNKLIIFGLINHSQRFQHLNKKEISHESVETAIGLNKQKILSK